MKKQLILLFSAIISLGILVACGSHWPIPTAGSSNKTSNGNVAGTSLSTPPRTVGTTGIPSSMPSPVANAAVKAVDIVNKYRIEVPREFTVQELLASPITSVPTYNFETPTGSAFSIFVLPYMVTSAPVPGKCETSTAFDAGTTSAPFFCEGLELTSSFTTPSRWVVKYGDTIDNLSQDCTMNSPCPRNVAPEARYIISYVFVIADKPRATTLEFYVGDAYSGSSNVVHGFEGLAAVMHDLIIPSLSLRNS